MAHAPRENLKRRCESLRRTLTDQALDAMVVTALPNVLYLTNFTGSAAILVAAADGLYFLTDSRYTTVVEQSRGASHECPDLTLVRVEGSYDGALAALLAERAWGRVGFEAEHVSVSRHDWLRNTLAHEASTPPALIATEHVIEDARLRKDDYEIDTLREGAKRLSRVAEHAFEEVRRGRTEREVAMAIDRRILEEGFSRPAFDTIVAAGENGALPHAHPGERTLGEGDLVVLDFGGVYDSYCVDLTRTVSVGAATPRAREVYGAVRAAHAHAIAAVAPGVSRFDIDAAARDTLSARGLGEAFGHGTGHGLGIDVHEDPRITRRRPDSDTRHEAVASGMVFTIEPGAYLAGWGGVRIEDDVLVTDAGVEVLTDVTTELIEI